MKPIRLIKAGLGIVLCVLAAACSFAGTQQPATVKDDAGGKGFAVLELFTSEGCSSCPPADALAAKIQQQYAGDDVYILAFHVDYWDRQGWKDRFSQHAFSERQRQYAEWLGLSTVYTPQLVINGTTELVGSDEEPINRQVTAALSQGTTSALTLNCTTEQGKLTIHAARTGGDKKAELVAALVQKAAQSNVRAGENAGRRLSHVQVVRVLGVTDISDHAQLNLDLPADFDASNWELVSFVQNKTNGRITAATRYRFPQ